MNLKNLYLIIIFFIYELLLEVHFYNLGFSIYILCKIPLNYLESSLKTSVHLYSSSGVIIFLLSLYNLPKCQDNMNCHYRQLSLLLCIVFRHLI